MQSEFFGDRENSLQMAAATNQVTGRGWVTSSQYSQLQCYADEVTAGDATATDNADRGETIDSYAEHFTRLSKQRNINKEVLHQDVNFLYEQVGHVNLGNEEDALLIYLASKYPQTQSQGAIAQWRALVVRTTDRRRKGFNAESSKEKEVELGTEYLNFIIGLNEGEYDGELDRKLANREFNAALLAVHVDHQEAEQDARLGARNAAIHTLCHGLFDPIFLARLFQVSESTISRAFFAMQERVIHAREAFRQSLVIEQEIVVQRYLLGLPYGKVKANICSEFSVRHYEFDQIRRDLIDRLVAAMQKSPR